jgi:alkanesulfonate monooxygenase SsuD/methylene tetrahydromethanopterin reductase-like flavin-dependent oxidoreductase (luciferase family)
MRVGLVLDQLSGNGDGGWAGWAAIAAEADSAGLDAVAVRAGPRQSALMLAAALAGITEDMRVVAEVTVSDHPVHLAERIAVADQALRGRLIVALDCAGNPGRTSEAIEVLRLALASRPFRHQGTHWRIPAGLPANNGHLGARRVRVTPAPVQLEVPIWVCGRQSRPVATALGIPWLAGPLERHDPGDAPAGRLCPVSRTMPPDRRAIIAALQAEAARELVDFALLAPPEGTSWRPGSARQLATTVRASLQLPELPDGIAEFWAGTVPGLTR